MTEHIGEKETLVTLEQVIEAVQEAKRFIASHELSSSEKVKGLRARSETIERLEEQAVSQAKQYLVTAGSLRESKQFDEAEEELRKVRECLAAARQCLDLLTDLEVETFRLTDKLSLLYCDQLRDATAAMVELNETAWGAIIADEESMQHTRAALQRSETLLSEPPPELLRERFGDLPARLRKLIEDLEEKAGPLH